MRVWSGERRVRRRRSEGRVNLLLLTAARGKTRDMERYKVHTNTDREMEKDAEDSRGHEEGRWGEGGVCNSSRRSSSIVCSWTGRDL